MADENPGQRAFKGVWMRGSLWKRKDLTWFEKCLLGEIDSFETCFASNKYLAEFMGTSEQTIQNAISKFRSLGLVIDWGDHKRRQLTVADNVSSDPIHDPSDLPRVGFTKPIGLPTPNPEVYIDTSIDTSVKEEGKKQAERIYAEYPKKVGKPEALKSILRQLRNFSFEDLLNKTISYAKARQGEDPRFTPNPSTWFNQQRFNDDISTWTRAPQSAPTPKIRPVEV